MIEPKRTSKKFTEILSLYREWTLALKLIRMEVKSNECSLQPQQELLIFLKPSKKSKLKNRIPIAYSPALTKPQSHLLQRIVQIYAAKYKISTYRTLRLVATLFLVSKELPKWKRSQSSLLHSPGTTPEEIAVASILNHHSGFKTKVRPRFSLKEFFDFINTLNAHLPETADNLVGGRKPTFPPPTSFKNRFPPSWLFSNTKKAAKRKLKSNIQHSSQPLKDTSGYTRLEDTPFVPCRTVSVLLDQKHLILEGPLKAYFNVLWGEGIFSLKDAYSSYDLHTHAPLRNERLGTEIRKLKKTTLFSHLFRTNETGRKYHLNPDALIRPNP